MEIIHRAERSEINYKRKPIIYVRLNDLHSWRWHIVKLAHGWMVDERLTNESRSIRFMRKRHSLQIIPDEKKQLSDAQISLATHSPSSACKHTVDVMVYMYTVKVSACELEWFYKELLSVVCVIQLCVHCHTYKKSHSWRFFTTHTCWKTPVAAL